VESDRNDNLPADDAPPTTNASPDSLGAADASTSERHWAMAAHLAALVGLTWLLNPITGILHIPSSAALGPLVVWLIKRGQSRYVAFHALQCLTLQVAALVVMLALQHLWLGDLVGLVNLAAMGYAVYAAIEVGNRRDFAYKYAGPWVRRRMGRGA
jgi:uncharacterized Tic20 family protein